MIRKLPLVLIIGLLALNGKTQLWGYMPLNGGAGQFVRRLNSPTQQVIPPLQAADLNGDGAIERIRLQNGQVEIVSGTRALWQNPKAWQVSLYRLTDINQDGPFELALLVWRPFQPWPVDRFLPHGGRISGFHNQDGLSCHLILIGFTNGNYDEIWAGSALAEPLAAFDQADLDGDGKFELVAIEGDYAREPEAGVALTAWEWNGFGFTLLARQPGAFRTLRIIPEPNTGDLLETSP